jgi:glycosyltransferase involved in cell wall biosynthesis
MNNSAATDRIEVLYVVPRLDKFGGIQTLALNSARLFNKSSSRYDIQMFGWYFEEIPIVTRGLARYLPSVLGKTVYSTFITPYFNKKLNSNARNVGIYHYWHVECCLPYNLRPYVVSVHGVEVYARSKGFRYHAYEAAFMNASAIHANSLYTKNLLLKTYPNIKPNNVIVINPSISSSYIHSAKSQDAEYVIGTLSRFVGRKNIPNVIKALIILKNDYMLNFVYNLAGDGPELKNIISELKQSGINYKYFGAISDEDKFNKFYPTLDIFVLPPLEVDGDVEGFGIVFLEANSSGVPVVAANTGGITDAVKQNVSGEFADPKNPHDIAEKIYKVLKSRKVYKVSARKWVRNFSPDKTAVEFVKLYDSVLNEKKIQRR